jgi:hypothetical protein
MSKICPCIIYEGQNFTKSAGAISAREADLGRSVEQAS